MRFETINIYHKYGKWIGGGQLSSRSLAELLSAAVKPHQRVVSMVYHENHGISPNYDIVLENHGVQVLDNVHENHTYYVNKCAKDWQEDSLLNPEAGATQAKPASRSRRK
ncbi:hypothetical protein [Vibrio phage vB_VpS_CC6]|nr:hypothetical protein [Vibrio phage vB_VpS_CC6]